MSEKEAGSVLTSENAAEFYANRLGLADEATETVAAKAEPDDADAQSEPIEADTAKPQEERKQNPKLERRFSEITKQREEARAEAQRERDARVELEKRIANLEQPKAVMQPIVEQGEPEPSQFQDAFEYAKALADYRVEAKFAQIEAQKVEERASQERQKVFDTWATKVAAAKAELPDFDDMVASASDVVIPDHVRDAMLESDVGPKILYHLAENTDIAKKISALPLGQALREIGKLEARFEAKPETKPSVARSKAPEPIKPIRASSGAADVPLTSDGEWHGTYQAWREARKAGKVR
jgi:hypothetical protein